MSQQGFPQSFPKTAMVMAAGLGMPTLFLILGIPCLIAGITMFTMAKVGRVQLVDAH